MLVTCLCNSASDDFNNAVVLTNRPLRPREMFEIQLDRMVDKWAGSIEIGVTSHSPLDIEFPATMTNIRSGTWMMTGNGVMHNGRMVQEDYGQNLDALKVFVDFYFTDLNNRQLRKSHLHILCYKLQFVFNYINTSTGLV